MKPSSSRRRRPAAIVAARLRAVLSRSQHARPPATQSGVTFFMPDLTGGGAERVTLDLCRRLADRGNAVRLVVAHASGPLAVPETENLTLVDLGVPRVLASGWRLRRLLRREPGSVLVGVLAHASVVLWFVRLTLPRRPGLPRLVLVNHNTMSIKLADSTSRRDRLLPRLMGLAFRGADDRVTVSEGSADDLAGLVHLPRTAIEVIPNPIDVDRILELSQQPVADGVLPSGWARGPGKVFVAAGRLVPAKDFATLLAAFARTDPYDRLLVLGEGPLAADLHRIAEELGVADRVSFPGFVANPYAVFAACDVFVLSSRFEGLPTVLLEVLALRTGVVSTDCPSGPREILDAGTWGALVPVADVDALAAAMRAATRRLSPPPAWVLDPYRPDAVCARYERLFDVDSAR